MKISKRSIALFSSLIFSILFSLLIKWAQTGNPFKAETIVYGTIIFLNVIILGSIGYSLLKRFSNKSPKQLKKSLIISYLLFVLSALVISLSLVSIGVYVFYLVKGWDTSNFLDQLLRVELTGAFKQFATWILIGSAVFFYLIWRKSTEREQRLREENLKYKYQNLKNQLNPHFLFNSLNTLSEIVYEDAAKADKYIQKLSRIYRYILDHEDADFISLDKEIEFVKQYFELQKIRDQNKIHLDTRLPDSNEIKIIPVSLQLLVENALKHNSRSEQAPLKILINKSEDFIIVTNNIQRRNTMEKTPKKGLKNLKERTRLVLGKDVVIREKDNQFIVKVPFLKK